VRRRDAHDAGADLMDAGLNNAVKDIEMGYPPEWRMSYSGRKAP
jgi:enoyl-CoA hydratase